MLRLSAVVERAMRRAMKRSDLSLAQCWRARRAIMAALYNPDGCFTQPFHYFDITGLRYALMRPAALGLPRLYPHHHPPPLPIFLLTDVLNACVWLAV